MVRVFGLYFILLFLVSCNDDDAPSEFTGNEMTYILHEMSDYPVSGTATFKEKKDGSTSIKIILTGTEGDVEHPVHLHYGSMANPGEVAVLLNPVIGSKGTSETLLTTFADETAVTYESLLEMEACIKVHLSSSGPGQNIVLAGGNIGTAEDEGDPHGREKM